MGLYRTTLLLLLSACFRVGPTTTEPVEEESCTSIVGTNDPGNLVLSNQNNFRYTASIDIEAQPLTEGQDSWVDWEDLTEDMLGHSLDPLTEVTSVFMVVFGNLDQAAVELAIETNNIPQNEVSLYLTCTPTELGCNLSDFLVLGTTDIDVEQKYFYEGSGTWMVVLASERQIDVFSYRRLLFVEPRTSGGSTTAQFSNDNGPFLVDADLCSLERPAIAMSGDVEIDWSNLTATGLGTALPLHRLDRLAIARYQDLSAADLEQSFVDLDLLADDYWELDIGQRVTANLSELGDEDNPFTGFDEDSLWMLALRCSTCSSPMPLFLTMLAPQG